MSKYSKNELLEIYNLPLDELFVKSSVFLYNKVELCSLISVKTGKCSENCKYCAQSSHYLTDIQSHQIVSESDVYKSALDAKNNSVSRFAIVSSGKSPEETDFETMLKMIESINTVEGITSCASLGFLTENQVIALKNAGLKRYHHNINTCSSYYSEICTTHNYQERINTIKLCKKHGLEICCGVILGMGETIEHRIEMAMELVEINPDSVPVNFLSPIAKTPFEDYFDKIDEEHILRSLALLKIALPNAVIRFAGGRNLRLSPDNQILAIKNCVDGMMVGNFLTTIGTPPQEDIKMLEDMEKLAHV